MFSTYISRWIKEKEPTSEICRFEHRAAVNSTCGDCRKSAKLKDDPATPPNEATQGGEGSGGSGSASQMSYDNQVGNFESYIEIVKNVPAYNPNEADLKVAALTAATPR